MSKLDDRPHYHLFWEIDEHGYRWPTLRDRAGELLQPATGHLESIVRSARRLRVKASSIKSELEAATYAVHQFSEFLAERGLKLYRVDDQLIADFRDHAYLSVRDNSISKDSDLKAKNTVNVKLVRVYKFIYWAQRELRLPRNTIGYLNCRVKSSLPEADSRAEEVDFEPNRLYPELFRGVGGSSRSDGGQYWATESDIDNIEDYFWERNSLGIASRNTMMLRIQSITTWRNASVNSLLVSQFSDEELSKREVDGHFLITPPNQKFGYEKAFKVDRILVHRIKEYIISGRAEILRKANSDERTAERRLFISETGHPLNDATYGEILQDAFKAVGCPKGSGGHSLRRFGLVKRVLAELSRRRALKLPIERATMVHFVMDVLGQDSEEAGRVYDRAVGQEDIKSVETQLTYRAEAAELERDRLRTLVAKLLLLVPADARAEYEQMAAPSSWRISKITQR